MKPPLRLPLRPLRQLAAGWSIPGAWARPVALLGCLSAFALASGCNTEPPATKPPETTKYTLENTDRFQYVDAPAAHAVTCTGLWEHSLGDGRLEVVANLKNRENRKVSVQTSCTFKNDQGVAVGGDSPWQSVNLAESETQAVRFTAPQTGAKQYTVLVRDAP